METTRYSRIINTCLLISILCACQEPYKVGLLDANKKILLVEGSISDQRGPYSVSLSWIRAFNTNPYDKSNIIKNASVMLMVDQGVSENLIYNPISGIYSSGLNGIQGIIGRTYYLHIQLQDGSVYESIPAKLEQSIAIDSIYAEAGEQENSVVLNSGENIKTITKGLNIYTDITIESTEIKYFKFEDSCKVQLFRKYKPLPPEIGYLCYLYSILKQDNIPNVKSSIPFMGMQHIKKHSIAFFPFYADENPDTAHYFKSYLNAGWVMSLFTKTISEASFNYYKCLKDQLVTSSQLFDPIAIQVKGNIICKSDTTQLAFGLFDVYSIRTNSRAFYYKPGFLVQTKDLQNPGPFKEEYTPEVKPKDWVNFKLHEAEFE